MKIPFILCLLAASVSSQGLLDGLGKLLNLGGGDIEGRGGPPRGRGGGGGGGEPWGPQGGGPGGWGGPPPRGGWGGPPPPGAGGWGGPPPPPDQFGNQPGGGGFGGRGGGPPPGGEGPGVLNLNGLLGNVMNEVGRVVQTGHFDLGAALQHITEGTGLEGIYEKLSLGGKNFLAPKPVERGIPPHVLRRIIRFCSRPQNQGHPKCQGHPEWHADDTLPDSPGQFKIDSLNDIFDLLNFQLPPLPQLAQQNLFTNVPENLRGLAPRPHKLNNAQKESILKKCRGGKCLKQPVDALNRRASIAEHEASVRRLLSPGRSQQDIDKDIETRFARTHQLKKAIMAKSGLGNDVEPLNDGVFQSDILLTTEQAEAMINAVNNEDPATAPVMRNAGKRKKRSSLFFEEQMVKKWPAGAIPYVFDSSLSASEQAVVQSAISEIQSKTCIKFQKLGARPSGSHIFYVKYASTAFCGLSNIGLNSLGNPVYLTFSCSNQNAKGVAIHETLHALGLAHEHVRSDRDDHITVNWDNVDPQNYQFFGVNDAKLFSSYGVTYDYGSIMHYANTVAGKQAGAITMTALQDNGRNGPLMGQRNGLSQRDIEVLNKMYCKPQTCKDENVYCGIWANRGKCSNTPTAWIFQHCKKSCNYC